MGIENYHVIELIGEGSFGKTVAMKFIMKQGKTQKGIHKLRQEIEVRFSVGSKRMDKVSPKEKTQRVKGMRRSGSSVRVKISQVMPIALECNMVSSFEESFWELLSRTLLPP
ncbi:hypothetical protein VNO80_19379 [Phaseolus coccineus]|uniref:non-specific serine/threonine protein kinase n=1 Tax=Phaseolus coccineus TaxID=3886 RepID=A0AAN9MKS8_PHACN